MTTFQVWFLIYVLPTIHSLLAVIVISLFIPLFFGSIYIGLIFMDTSKIPQEFTKLLREMGIALILTLVISAIVPSKEQIAQIYLVKKISNNESIKELPENLLKYINNIIGGKNE